MLLSPRYEGETVLSIEGPVDDQRVPIARQRRRLEVALGALTEEQWRAPSRCAEWSVQDVIAHLVGTNTFWQLSIARGLAGAPSRFLAAFDPVLTPAQMVEPMRSMTPRETLDELIETDRALLETIEALDGAGWSTIGESPIGHVPIRLLAHHALWDSWVHERDVLLPLSMPVVEEADEVASSLRYAAALGPALATSASGDRVGSLVVDATDPDARFVVEVGASVRVSRRRCAARRARAARSRR